MITHVSIGVKNVDRSKRFYDAALQPLGYRGLRPAKTSVGDGYGVDSIFFWILSAERPVPADEKSGLHICFAAPNTAAVDTFHKAALHFCGKGDGAARLRSRD